MNAIRALLLLLVSTTVALAQPAPQNAQTQTFSAWTLRYRAPDLTAGVVSSRVTLTDVKGPVAIVYNMGPVAAYVNAGNSSVVATLDGGIPVPAGGCTFLNITGADHLAGIVGSNSALLQTAVGTGNPGSCSSSSGGGSGGSVFVTNFPSGFGINGLLPAYASTPTFNIGGGNIGNTAFGISGLLPGFAATPTVNLGTIGNAATQTTLVAIETALGTPFQAGGSIGNTSFGISGTLPSFASVQHFICDSGCSGGGGGISVTFGAAIGTVGTPVGFKDGSGNFQALLGDVTNGQWTSVKASVLPTGAATSALQSSIISALGSPFQAGGSIGNAAFGISGTLPAFAATPTVNLGTIGTAATAANQTTGNSSLSSIDGKTPALGQALAAGSVPVVLTASQLSTLTPLSSVTVTQSTAASLNATVVGTGTFAVQATQSGSWAVTANAGTNLNTSLLALETGGNLASVATNTSTTNTDIGAPGAVACTTDTASCSLNQQNQRVAQRLTTINTTLGTPFQAGGSIGNTTFAATQATAASLNATVVGTGTFAVQLTGATNNINNIAGTISLPTGAGTSANQTAIQAPVAAATATATKSVLLGGQFDTTQKTLTNGQQAALSVSARGAMFVAVGADGFAVTNAGTFAVQATLNATPSLANGNGVVPTQGGSVLSATNGIFSNVLQGNAVLSATNGLFANVLQGNAVLSQTNPGFSAITDGTNKAAVKAASTAPVAADPALVAALSPNGNQATAANQTGPNTASVTNPTSTLTLPSTTTAYAAGTLICTSATVATCNTGVAASTIAIPNSAGGFFLPRMRLTSNDATSTAWSSAQIQIDLWTTAPTFATTGDRGVFNTDFLTGSAGHFGSYTCIMQAELADGIYSECYPIVGNGPQIKLASGTTFVYTLTAVNGSGVTGASKVFTVTAELQN